MSCIQIAKAMGARVIAAASTDDKLDYACKAGADLRINYSNENLKEKVKELTGGKGADVIYDPVGGDYSEQAFRAVAWDGRGADARGSLGRAGSSVRDTDRNHPKSGFASPNFFCEIWQNL